MAGRPKSKQFLGKLRTIARSIAQMEAGVYEWPDGKPHLDKDGCYIVNKREALRSAGYEHPENYGSADEKIWNNNAFEEFLSLERIRLKHASIQHVQDVKGDISSLRKASAAELQVRFEHDPGQFTINELLKIFQVMEEFERREKGLLTAGDASSSTYNIQNLTISMADKLPEAEYEEFIEQAEKQKEEELDRVRQIRSAMKAKTKEQENDIIEGELVGNDSEM